ncbi:MAG: LysR family transcriptional regulator [Clostridia bacterium]|nr:LysR family transcriptional regulator [Clostridia bacterium]
MTIRHIRIFEAVCDAGCNTTRAAEALHMTQPAVSLAISELESYYGVLLFDRIARRLYLTEAGAEFLDYARRITLTFDDMETTVRNWESKGVLRVGASVSVGAKLMPELTARFRKTHPDIRVKVRIDRSDRLEEAIAAGETDFALIEGIAHGESLIVEDFMEDRLALVTSPDTVEPGSTVSREDFLRMEFLLRERGSGTREIFESTLAAASLPPPAPMWESLSTAALMNAAKAGLGMAVVPHRMAEEAIASGSLAEFFVEGLTFRRTYKIVYHRDKRFTKSARDFLALCRETGVSEPIQNRKEN